MLLVLGTRMLLVSGIATKTKKTDGSIVSLSQGNRFKPDPHVQTNPQYHTIDNNIYIYIKYMYNYIWLVVSSMCFPQYMG